MQKNPKAERLTRRGFTWGIRSTDIAFMHVSPAQAALDGSSNDCGCGLAKFDPPRARRRPVKKPGGSRLARSRGA